MLKRSTYRGARCSLLKVIQEAGDGSKSSLNIMMAYIYSPDKQRSGDTAHGVKQVLDHAECRN